MQKTIEQLQKEIFEANKEKGFWDKERNVGEMLMLVVSELGEAIEAHRKGRSADTQDMDEMASEGLSWEKHPGAFVESFKQGVKDTFEDELADAAIRIFDMAGGLGIDLSWHIENKLAYNKTRPRLHGKSY